MFHRSLKMKRPMVWNACWIVLLLLSALPRLTVHSHAGLNNSGVNATAISQHLQLFHSNATCDVSPDCLHIHWLLGNGTELSVGSAVSSSVDNGYDQLAILDDCSAGLMVSQLVPSNLSVCIQSVDDIQPSANLRICFCVWTC